MKNYYLFILIFLLSTQFTQAKVYQVGPGRTYTKPSQLENIVQDGDTVEIDAAEYVGDVTLWTKNNLVLRGVGGRPHFRANGVRLRWDKSIWLIMGNDVLIENIEFSEATVPLNKGGNGAGIRTEPQATNLTIRNCYFHDNQNGILIPNNVNSNIVIEYCEFAFNGFGDTGFTHNMYINRVESFTLRFCYSHHIKADGHLVKSRAAKNYILYNRLADEPGGTSSRMIDLSNGGESYVIGNVMIQNAEAINKNLVGYGLEGYTHPKNELYLVNNTMINYRFNGTFLDIRNGADKVQVINNVMVGPGDRILGLAETFNNLDFNQVSEVGFQDVANEDYRPVLGSDLIDAGIDPGTANNFHLLPSFEYQNALASSPRPLIQNVDVGAYEFTPACPDTLIQEEFYSLCEGDSLFLGGAFQKQSGTYYDSLTTQAGCDSIIIHQLLVNPLPSRPRIELTEPNILCASTEADIYQWFLNGEMLDATGSCIEASQEGEYTVIATKNTCSSDISEAFNFTITAIESPLTFCPVKIYPNPTTENVLLDLGESPQTVRLVFVDVLGNIAKDKTLNYQFPGQALELQDLQAGTYILKLYRDCQLYSELIIIE